MRLRRLGVRTRLLTAVLGVVALALAVAVTASSFLLGQRLGASATALARAQAAAEVATLEIRNGQIVTPERPREGALVSQTWIFAGDRVLQAPKVPAEIDLAARSLANGPKRSLDVREHTRLYALPIVQNGARYGTVVSAVSLDAYEETGRTALIGSLILAFVLFGAITVLSWWTLGKALLPVSRMTKDAASWSEHDLDRRFGLGEPYDELTQLAWTLDGLLERLAASLRHEQRFAVELSHELRTPLARAKGHTELALRRERTSVEYREALEAIQGSVEEMTRTVETLVAAARQESGLTRATSDSRDAVRVVVDSVRDAGSAVELRVTVPSVPARVAVEQELVERMIQPLVENAVRYGRSVANVSLVRNGSSVLVQVVDDGPGVAEHELVSIFEPGTRGVAAGGDRDGAGLGLSLAQRLARSAGGEIAATASSAGGQFTLRLPLAP
jgi:signal transduction histidine kinase